MDRKKRMIAQKVKDNRVMRGLTQQELSEKTNISLRSIQRIENGEVNPRMHTLKTLARYLNFSLDNLTEEKKYKDGKPYSSKVILATGIGIVSALLVFAYIVQLPDFPETTFELLILVAVALALYMLFLYKLFR